MRRTLAFVATVALVAGVATHAAAKPADKGTIRRLFPADVFGDLAKVNCKNDKKGDFFSYSGKKPGRHDAFVDIKRVCTAYIDETPEVLTRLEQGVPCGPGEGWQVVCSPSKPSIGESDNGGITAIAMEVRGDIPSQRIDGETGRLSVYVRAKGDKDSLVKPSDSAPNTSSQGTNLTYQAIYGTPGTTTTAEPIELLAIDHRLPNEFLMTSHARIWIRNRIVVFILPEFETGELDQGVRVAMFWANEANPGDEDTLDEDIAPGGPHPPWGYLGYIGKN